MVARDTNQFKVLDNHTSFNTVCFQNAFGNIST